MNDPSDEAIRQVCEFAGLDLLADRQLIISALKANSNNVEAVIAAYYDSGSKFRQTYAWSESPFFGDRDHTDDPDVPSFTINSADESNIIQGVNPNHISNTSFDGDFPYLDSAPPSHPPSRATSPVPPRNIGGWINETQHAQYGIPKTVAQEDEELERALAESAAMSGIHTPQETGIIGIAGMASMIGPAEASQPAGVGAAIYPSTSIEPSRPDIAPKPTEQDSAAPYFGPANRPAYNANDWALTRIEPSSKYAKPSARTRAPQTPAFLGSTDSNYLNATLTALHSIAAARNALLNFGGVEAHTYGNNPDWWKGQQIKPVGNLKRGPEEFGVTTLDEESEEVYIAPPSVDRDPDDNLTLRTLPLGTNVSREFIEEVQRLMAFLDGTERSYAYVEALENMHLINVEPDSDKTRQFSKALSYFGLADFNNSLFTTVTMVRYAAGKVQEKITDRFMLLDLSSESNVDGDSLPCTSLYNLLDNAYWSWLGADVGPEPLQEVAEYKTAFISRMAPVQLFRLNPRDNRSNATGSFQTAAYSLEGLSSAAAGLKEPLKTGAYVQPPPIEIPETLYLDRYAEENQEWALEIQDKMRRIMAELDRLHKLIAQIDPSGNKANPSSSAPEQDAGRKVEFDAVALYRKRISRTMTHLWQYKTKLLWERSNARGVDFNSADVDAVQPETDAEKSVFALLRAELAVAKKQLTAYREIVGKRQAQRDSIWRLLTTLRRKCTEPTKDTPLKYKYKLRGVVVSAKRFYICRRELVPEPEVIDLENNDDSIPIDVDADEAADKKTEEIKETKETKETDETKETKETVAEDDTEKKTPVYRDQWWKIMHRDESTFVQKSTVEAALADAQSLQMQIVLAYCTDEAWTAEPDPLSDALKTFVKHDNRHFKTEREAERKETLEQAAAAQNKKRTQQGTPVDDYSEEMLPIKRRNQQSSSVHSMAANRLDGPGGWSGSQASSIASDKAYAGDDAALSDRDMEDMPLLSRQESRATKADMAAAAALAATATATATATTTTAAAAGPSLEPIPKEDEPEGFKSEDSNGELDDGGADKNAQVEEAIRASLQDQEKAQLKEGAEEEKAQEEAQEPVQGNHPAIQSSPFGKSMGDLAISQEAEGKLDEEKTATERVMQEQARVPKSKDQQYPKEKDKRAAEETDRQFSTGVQLMADWDNPEGRYVPDDMDES